MASIFDRYPQFINNDPRRSDDHHVGWDANTQLVRYQGWLSPDAIRDKNILDIGCAGAAFGAYALDSGARSYTGLEISPVIANMAEDNFRSAMPDGSWNIYCQSVEKHFESDSLQYDIIVAAGVMHGITDILNFLSNTSQRCSTLIIEAFHPALNPAHAMIARLLQLIPTDKERADFLRLANHVAADWPVIEVHPHGKMCVDDSKGSTTNILKMAPSIGALVEIMHRLGFGIDRKPYDELCKTLPRWFGPRRRFAVRFDRTHDALPMSYNDMRSSDSIQFEAWADRKQKFMGV